MKIASYDIVFQEIPDEVTLALNISQCPCHCPGCHSPHLADDIGEELSQSLLDSLIETYGKGITCVCMMGGDATPCEVNRWLAYIHTMGLKTAWYSGREHKSDDVSDDNLDYLKLGPYIAERGALKSPGTNQRLYKRCLPAHSGTDAEHHASAQWADLTPHFWRHK